MENQKTLSEFQKECERLDNANSLADFFRKYDLSELNKNDILYLLTRISQISGTRHGLEGYLGFIRDELNDRRSQNHNHITRVIAWLALAASIFVPFLISFVMGKA